MRLKESSPAAEIRYVKTQKIGLGALGLCLIEELFLLDFFIHLFCFKFLYLFSFSNSNKSVSRRGGGAVETPTKNFHKLGVMYGSTLGS